MQHIRFCLPQMISIAMNSPRSLKTAITDAVVELGLVGVFADIYRSCFCLDWSGPKGQHILTNLQHMGNSMVNATDRSVVLCTQVVDTGLAGDILKYLNEPKLHADRMSADGVESVVSSLRSILHNVVQVGCLSRLNHNSSLMFTFT